MEKFIKHFGQGFKMRGHPNHIELSYTSDGRFVSTTIYDDDLKQLRRLLGIKEKTNITKAKSILKREILNFEPNEENWSHYTALVKIYNLLDDC